MNCLSCTQLDLQKFPAQSAVGNGYCPHQEIGKFMNMKKERDCKQFKAAAPDVVAKRIKWAAKI